MFGEFLAACNGTIAVARRVVGPHGAFVVVSIVRDRPYALDGILRFIQFGKDVAQVFADAFIADDDALTGLSLEVNMLHMQRVENDAGRLGRQANSQQLKTLFESYFQNLTRAFYEGRSTVFQ